MKQEKGLRFIQEELKQIEEAGLKKTERILQSAQGAEIAVPGGEVLNFCANNYLGLANHPEVVAAAKEGLDRWGFGLSSVRFICGTQALHKQLEARVSDFLGTDDTILYSSCFDANGGLFETLLGPEDAVISDALNHASIIDGVRLCKAQRKIYPNSDMAELEERLKETQDCRIRLIATDGVFSMDGTIADLKSICDLADKYNALVMVDDSHSVGVLGANGRGTHEYRDVMGRIDIITGTFGKALGGASGGYTSARQVVIDLLRQRSRPYLFSNTLAPAVASATLKALELVSSDRLSKLEANTTYFRSGMRAAGFDVPDGDHPIVPIMLGDARLATAMADKLLERGIYVIGFSFPVVPKGLARIRVQISAAHSTENLDRAIAAFAEVHGELAEKKEA
ncbi:glycine C-acetyltransferase [Pontiella sp.]|uniref:glycine C-acetyltransferase n=1 Tax=Pontiella sp. TaxID=2837462 RepID=UPI003569420C